MMSVDGNKKGKKHAAVSALLPFAARHSLLPTRHFATLMLSVNLRVHVWSKQILSAVLFASEFGISACEKFHTYGHGAQNLSRVTHGGKKRNGKLREWTLQGSRAIEALHRTLFLVLVQLAQAGLRRARDGRVWVGEFESATGG